MTTSARFLLAVLLLVAPACAEGPTRAQTRADADGRMLVASPPTSLGTNRHVKGFTLRVRNKACLGLGTGSAVLISPDVLVTNRHVVEWAAEIEVESWDGQRRDATIATVRTFVDLAAVRLSESFADLSPAPLGVDPSVGDAVRAVGYPLGRKIQVSPGAVTAVVDGHEYGQIGDVIEFDAPVRPGNSGGPLVDEQGLVVGIVFARNLVENRSLAVSVSHLESTVPDDSGEPEPARPRPRCR